MKRLISVITSGPTCKEGNARFTNPLNALQFDLNTADELLGYLNPRKIKLDSSCRLHHTGVFQLKLKILI